MPFVKIWVEGVVWIEDQTMIGDDVEERINEAFPWHECNIMSEHPTLPAGQCVDCDGASESELTAFNAGDTCRPEFYLMCRRCLEEPGWNAAQQKAKAEAAAKKNRPQWKRAMRKIRKTRKPE